MKIEEYKENELSSDELAEINGGYIVREYESTGAENRTYRLFQFDEEECKIIAERTGVHVTPRGRYNYKWLNKQFGIRENEVWEVDRYLSKLGIQKTKPNNI